MAPSLVCRFIVFYQKLEEWYRKGAEVTVVQLKRMSYFNMSLEIVQKRTVKLTVFTAKYGVGWPSHERLVGDLRLVEQSSRRRLLLTGKDSPPLVEILHYIRLLQVGKLLPETTSTHPHVLQQGLEERGGKLGKIVLFPDFFQSAVSQSKMIDV